MIWAYSNWPLLNQMPIHVFKVTKGIMIECPLSTNGIREGFSKDNRKKEMKKSTHRIKTSISIAHQIIENYKPDIII